jgi:hypothetical protein
MRPTCLRFCENGRAWGAAAACCAAACSALRCASSTCHQTTGTVHDYITGSTGCLFVGCRTMHCKTERPGEAHKRPTMQPCIYACLQTCICVWLDLFADPILPPEAPYLLLRSAAQHSMGSTAQRTLRRFSSSMRSISSCCRLRSSCSRRFFSSSIFFSISSCRATCSRKSVGPMLWLWAALQLQHLLLHLQLAATHALGEWLTQAVAMGSSTVAAFPS